MDARGIVKKMLMEYSDIMPYVRELNRMLNELKDLGFEPLKATAPQLAKSAPTNKISDPVGELAVNAARIAEGYASKINALLDQKRDTEHMLAQLEPIERRIVELRYINNPPYRCDIWMWIGGQVHYSPKQAQNIHNRALDKMARWYKV